MRDGLTIVDKILSMTRFLINERGSKMKRFVVTDIEYDTDDNVSLPKELIMEIPDDELDNIWDYVSNEISKRTGYCHKGFTIEEVSK